MATQRSLESALWFLDYDPTSLTFVYDDQGAVAADTGRVLVTPFVRKTIVFAVDVLAAVSLTVQVEAQLRERPGRWLKIWTKTFIATGQTETFVTDSVIDFLRVGVKVFGPVAGNQFTAYGTFR